MSPSYGCTPSWELNAKSAGVKWRSTRFGSTKSKWLSCLGLGSVGKNFLASGTKFCGIMRRILFHSLQSMITFGHIVSMKKMSGSCSLLFTNGPYVKKKYLYFVTKLFLLIIVEFGGISGFLENSRNCIFWCKVLKSTAKIRSSWQLTSWHLKNLKVWS